MRAFLLGLVAALVLAGSVRGQDSYRELAREHQRVRAYNEAFVWPDGEASELAVVFRIPNAMLVFKKNPQVTGLRSFEARAEVTVQLYQRDEKVDEQTWRRMHHVATFEATQSREQDLQGFVRFAAPPGRYHYRLRFVDSQSGQERTTAMQAVTVPDFGGLQVGAAVLARRYDRDTAALAIDLANLGGDAPFGQPTQALVPVALPDTLRPEQARLRYRLVKVDPKTAAAWERHGRPDDIDAGGTGMEVTSGSVVGEAFQPVPSLQAATFDDGRLQWASRRSPGGYLAAIDLEGTRRANGTYLLHLTLEAGKTSVQRVTSFRTHWRGMPLALHDPRVAIQTLRFIEDRDTVRRLQRGARAEQGASIRAYWQQRDPTPGTVFNELMAEYYRRVDYAADAFRTGTVLGPDGLETDRARIYIAYGPPEEVERTLPHRGGVEEHWIYAGGRRFVFWAATSLDAFRLQEQERP